MFFLPYISPYRALIMASCFLTCGDTLVGTFYMVVYIRPHKSAFSSSLRQSLFLAHSKFQVTDDDEQPAQPLFCCVSADPRIPVTKPPTTTATSECIYLYDLK